MATFTATLLENERLAPKTFVLHLAGCEPLEACRPGQFVMLRGQWGRDPLLPRAFSVMAVHDDGVAEILVKTIGRGTALLETALPGSRFQVLGPLGSSFPAPSPDRTDWLVAGGVGLAPLLFQLESELATRTRLFYGGRSAADLVLLGRLARTGATIHLASDDGTLGARGRVTALLEGKLGARAGDAPTLLACGPDPMLQAVARLARARRLKTYLSLEGEMACGIGICLGCAVPCVSKPYRYTCTDGPVLDLDDLRGPYAAESP
jgi:dihydroorotate dehydrogenase electron transfer subunit